MNLFSPFAFLLKASSTEELVKALQDDAHQQRKVNSELKKTSEEEKRSLEQKVKVGPCFHLSSRAVQLH